MSGKGALHQSNQKVVVADVDKYKDEVIEKTKEVVG